MTAEPMSEIGNATVTEISRRAGCSIATVSRVINNSGAVSPQTRASVLKAIRETQYLSARSARRIGRKAAASRDTESVIEIVQHRHSPLEDLSTEAGRVEVGPLHEAPRGGYAKAPLGSSFYRRIVDGAVEELGRWGFRAQLRIESDLLNADMLANINSPARKGVLLLGEASPKVEQFVEQCIHPVVLVDLNYAGRADVVTSDNFAGIRTAFDHLYSLGHRRIGYVGRRDEDPSFFERFTMYKLKMAEANLPVRPDWVYTGHTHIDLTAAGVRRILELKDRPSALIAANDCYALGVIRAAAALGISIPKDLSVVGFDDEDFSSLVTPPLTTIHVPLSEMGRQAVRQLMIPILGGPPASHRGCAVRLLPELVVRASSAPPA